MPFDGVAGAQAEAADLRRRDVDVVRAGQVVVVGRAQEAEAVGQGLEDAVAVDFALVGGGVLEEREDEVLASHAADAFDVQLRAHVDELGHLLALQLGQIHDDVSRSGGAWMAVVGWDRCLSIGGKYGLLVRSAENARRYAGSCQAKMAMQRRVRFRVVGAGAGGRVSRVGGRRGGAARVRRLGAQPADRATSRASCRARRARSTRSWRGRRAGRRARASIGCRRTTRKSRDDASSALRDPPLSASRVSSKRRRRSLNESGRARLVRAARSMADVHRLGRGTSSSDSRSMR